MLLENPQAFLSYCRFDNDHDHDAITWLHQRLGGELKAQTGKEWRIFHDIENIKPGEIWEQSIETAITSSYLLIVVMTPSYFESGNCLNEYNWFRERERSLGRDDLIIPIYYITVPALESIPTDYEDEWFKDLARRQYIDWRGLRFEYRTSQETSRTIFHIASEMTHRLSTISPSESRNDTPKVSSEDSQNRTPYEQYVWDTYHSELSTTQQDLLKFTYANRGADDVYLDDIFSLFRLRHGDDVIPSTAEMYYRIRVLAFQGLLGVHLLGRGKTRVAKLPNIKKALKKLKIIPS